MTTTSTSLQWKKLRQHLKFIRQLWREYFFYKDKDIKNIQGKLKRFSLNFRPFVSIDFALPPG